VGLLKKLLGPAASTQGGTPFDYDPSNYFLNNP